MSSTESESFEPFSRAPKNLPFLTENQMREVDRAMLDAIFGYSARGDPREPAAGLIRAANSHFAAALTNDIPSGIEATSGRVGDPAVTATATVTIALPKTGLQRSAESGHVGELYLGDISVPPELYAASFPEMDAARPFVAGHIVRVW